MAWKNLISIRSIASRRRLTATAIVYGLSLAIRFTSATGEEVEIPAAQSMHWSNPPISIMTGAAQLPYADWRPNAARLILFRRGWPDEASSSCTPP